MIAYSFSRFRRLIAVIQRRDQEAYCEYAADRREKTEKWQRRLFRSGQHIFPRSRDAVGRDLDAITIRLSPSVVLLQSGYQLSNPLISVHSIYVRLSSRVDRRGDNDLPVWESARRCDRESSAQRVPCS